MKKRAEAKPKSKRVTLIESTTAHAFPLMQALSKELGDFLDWEPESIWLELDHLDIKIPEVNKNKVMAAIALELVPAFYYDAMVYENTAIAFNHLIPNTDALQEANPEWLAWAVIEASLLRGKDRELPFYSETERYTAVVLHRAGFTVAPDELAFSQSSLDFINLNKDSKKDVQEIWTVLPRKKLADIEFEENEKEIHLARLAAIHLYVEEKRTECNKQLAELDGS